MTTSWVYDQDAEVQWSSTSVSNLNWLWGAYVKDSDSSLLFGQFEEGKFNVWNQSFIEGNTGKSALFHSFFPRVFEIAQPDFTRRDGAVRTLSRIWQSIYQHPYGWSTRLPLLFACPGEPWRTCGHTETDRSGQPGQTHSKLDVQTSGLLLNVGNSSATTSNTLTTRSSLRQTSKLSLKKARRRTVRELSPKTPDSLGAKLLTASASSRAYRNRHLGTLMLCCEVWELVVKFVDQNSFECIDFHGLSQIIASLTRERHRERERLKSVIFIGHKRKRTTPWRSADLVFVFGAPRKPTLFLHAGDEDGNPLENEDESGRRLCEFWCTIFQARVQGERHHCHEVTTSAGKLTETNLMNSWP